ncbi:MAG: carbohydrate kinase [Lachnospiraceae bacterium]|nr:carbohydrate kinase [Lachnospiraceae bacterium]
MKKYDVAALGELLIDFTENGVSAQGNPVMEANPGGAPCNVLALLQKLGHTTGFIGKVGKDMFGNQLEKAFQEVGISTECLIRDPEVNTTLAFVHTFEDGDRDFSFYRKPGADMMLSKEDITTDAVQNMIRSAKIFHFGSLSMTAPVCRKATREAIRIAEEAGCIISFDPNLREPLWSSLDAAREQIAYGMGKCHMLKISDNEISWFTGTSDYEEGVQILRDTYPNIQLLLVSLGKDGSMAFSGGVKVQIPAFLQPDTIETTGAGDTFCGSVLHYLLENNEQRGEIRVFTAEELTEMVTFANAAASLITTRKGALRVMPERKEILAMLH